MNRKLRNIFFFIAFSVSITQVSYALASVPTPTLDNLKKQSQTYSAETPFALETKEPSDMNGYSKVHILGTTYYFKPETDGLARTLSATPSGNLISASQEDAVFEVDGEYYKFDTNAISKSSFRYVDGTSEDYNLSVKKTDEDGKLFDEFYKIAFEDEKGDVLFGTSPNVSWKKATTEEIDAATDIVEIKLPHNGQEGDSLQDKRYYKYNFTPTEGREKHTSPQTNPTGNVDADFIGITGTSSGGAIRSGQKIESVYGNFIDNHIHSTTERIQGGAIYNDEGTINHITGNFIGNYATSSIFAGGGAIYTKSNTSIDYIIGNFIANHSDKGGAIYSWYTKIKNINGDFVRNNATIHGGAIFLETVEIDSLNGTFIGNFSEGVTVALGGSIYVNGAKVGNITADFVGNYTKGSTYTEGGAIYIVGNSSEIGNITGDFIANYAIGSGYVKGGAIVNTSTSSTIGDITGNFIGNYAKSSGNSAVLGGAIYNTGVIDNITGDFIGNYISSNKYINTGAAIYNQGTITVSTTEQKPSILFENNISFVKAGTADEIKKLNSINLGITTAVVNFKTIEDTHINIRDPISSFDNRGKFRAYGTLNKTGAGAFYLWGDNSEFGGTMNMQEGDFIAMFDETDEWVQRHEFNLSKAASLNFADGTTFRPMVTATKIADLGKAPNVVGDVNLRPFNVSSLNKGDYNYAVDYSQFKGIENELIKVDATSGSVDVSIKRDLAGYEKLAGAVDAYRKLSNLSVSDRMIFDNIYYTGSVPQDIKDEFKEVIKVVSGEDKIIINEVHKASIRQFSRQIYSRIQNKNCPSCGMTEGYSDEHLWFNVGKNFIDKDTNGENVGYKYDPTSLAIGYDHDIIPNALNMGIAFSYAFGDVKGKGKSIYNTADIDEYMLSLYWKYKPLRAYMTGSVGGGYMNSNSKVRGDSIDVTGDSDTIVSFINTEFGYDFGNACGVFEPFVGLEYAYIYNKAYTEKGLGARHFKSSDYNSIELPIGFRVSRNMMLDSYIFTPSIELAYSRSLGDRTSEVSSYFVGSPESPWVMRGANDSRDSLRSSLNLKVNNIYNPFALNFGYARDTRSDYSDDQLYLTVRYNF